MTPEEIIALVTAILAAAPTLTVDAVAALKNITTLFQSNPTASAADIQAAIAATAAQTLAGDQKVEQTTITADPTADAA